MYKERYLEIVSVAKNDRKKSKSENLYEQAVSNSLVFKNSEERQVYINNFMILNDNELMVKFFENNKDANKTSKQLNVSLGVVMAKIMEIKMFGPINKVQRPSDEFIKDQNAFLKRQNENLISENSQLLQEIEKLKAQLERYEHEENIKKR